MTDDRDDEERAETDEAADGGDESTDVPAEERAGGDDGGDTREDGQTEPGDDGEAGRDGDTGDAGDADQTGGDGDGGHGAPDEERLDRLGDQIAQARSRARDTIGEPEEKFYESGDDESEHEDDQTIAPPG
jgi:hypothetical protein